MEQNIADNQHFIYYVFHLTAATLFGLSKLSGLSYQCWNILVWFGLLPSIWIGMISKKTTVWLNLISVALFAAIFAIHTWDKWFNQAVVLLNKMAAWFHTDYKSISVYVCVFLPMVVFAVLSWTCLSKKAMKWTLISMLAISILVIIFFPISNMLIRDFV